MPLHAHEQLLNMYQGNKGNAREGLCRWGRENLESRSGWEGLSDHTTWVLSLLASFL